MKSLCIILSTIFICINSYGQQVVVVGSSQYGISGNLIFKADTLGNTNWVLDFSGRIKAGITDTNHLINIASDGRLLYITSLQTNGTSLMTYYPATSVLDTFGNIIAIRYHDVTSSGSYSIIGTMPNINGGIWFYDYYISLSHHLSVTKIDTLGDMTYSIGAWMSTDTYFTNFSLKRDSSYVLSTTTPIYMSPNCFGTITKTDRDGNAVWRRSINHNTLLCFPDQNEVDSAGNLIMFFYVTNNSNINYCVGAIFNSNGSVIAQRTWQYSLIRSNGNISFQNNRIIYDDGLAKFNFDYSLIDSCLGAGLNGNVYFTPETLQVSQGGYTRLFSAFVPTTHSAIQVAPVHTMIFPPQNSLDYCITLNDNGISNEDPFSLFPNPVNEKLHILSDALIYSEEIQFEIFDINNKIIEKGQINSNGNRLTVIDVNEYKTGFYFVRIKSNRKIYVARFIKL